jgi:peptidoglycan/LPS O-acetylase OafA/YrhL
MPGEVPQAMQVTMFMSATLLASVVLHHGVELPSRRLGRDLVRHWLGDPAAVGSTRRWPGNASWRRAAE